MNSFCSPLLRVWILGAIAVVASAPIVLGTGPTVASTGYGASYYISPPLVQNSYVTTGAILETFDSGTNGTSCNGTVPIGVISGNCGFSNGFMYGGATTESSSPVAGGTSTMYATGSGGSPPTITFTFSGARRYLGFWWSAGSPTNTVKFFNGPDEVLALTTADLISLLGSSAGTFGTTGSVTAADGSTYVKHHYFGHPRGHSQASPVSRSSVTNGEPFTYLHVFTSGGLTFDKVTFSGNGFEFDNLVVSNVAQSPAPNLVTVGSITGTMPASAKTVIFNPGDGTGTMMNQVASAAEALSTNTFTRTGYTFAGWHTTRVGTGGVSYSNGQTYDFSADLTLYAQWTPDPLTVTYDTQGGSSIANGSTTTGASISSSPGTPTQSGFTFNGWFTASSGGSAITFPYVHGRTANFTLYAQWSIAPSTTVGASPPVATTSPPTTTTAAPSSAPTPDLDAPKNARPGQRVTIVATGFLPGESVLMTIGGSNVQRRVTADVNGEVRMEVKLSSLIRGDKVLALAKAGSGEAKKEIEISSPNRLPDTGGTATLLLGLAAVLLALGSVLSTRRRPV
jgi:uncharacterized repeat protein (TIGR02543 family)/LPXTG-motif cell wall-anchored protein